MKAGMKLINYKITGASGKICEPSLSCQGRDYQLSHVWVCSIDRRIISLHVSLGRRISTIMEYRNESHRTQQGGEVSPNS